MATKPMRPFQAVVIFKVKMLGLLALLSLITLVPTLSYAADYSTKFLSFGAQSSSEAAIAAYHYLGKAYGQGIVLNSMVGPGQSATNQLFYQTYTYIGGSLDFVAIDPNTGAYKVYPSPANSEEGAWALASGPDNNIYIGTLPNAHLLKFNTGLQQLTDIGQVPSDPTSSIPQRYIWQLTVSPHTHKIYGCTYPSADLVSYDPLDATPQLVNLGTMDPTGQEQYARTCVADPNPNSPYIYIGLGSVSTRIVAYNTDTKTIIPLTNSSLASFGWVYPGVDGNVYGMVLYCSPCQYYLLSNGGYTQVSSYVQPAATNVLNNKNIINVNASKISVTHPWWTKTYPYTYTGKDLSIFRIGLGPNDRVYGGTVLPYDFFVFYPGNPSAGVQMKGQIGNGEPYSLLAYNNLLYIAGYSSPSLQIYNPSQSFNKTNPLSISSGNFQADLRPQAMVAAPDGKLYIGSVGSYGILSGPLIAWNTQNNSDIQEYFPIQNQGVASLATTTGACQDSSGSYCLIGGTTIFGGEGTTPSASAAVLFSWDPATNTVVHQYAIPNAPDSSTISDLVTNPANGYVYGIATNRNGSYVFIFNPGTGQFINVGTILPFYGTIYSSVAIYNGNIWGVMSQGVFSINLNDVSQSTLIASSVPITAGFAMKNHTLYFASNSGLWSYTTA